MTRVARLHSGTFYVRERDGELWNFFRLRLTTSDGHQEWDTGWGSYGSAAPWAGKGVDAFECQMRTSFDDLMGDLRQARLRPDRGYDELPVDVDLPDSLRAFVEQQ